MNAMTSAILVIIIVSLLAVIAFLYRKPKVAFALVILIGALLGHTPGSIGEWSDQIATFTLGAPKLISDTIASVGA